MMLLSPLCEAVLSKSKKRKLEFPESSSSKDKLDQLQSFIEKRGVDLVPTFSSGLPQDHTLWGFILQGHLSAGLLLQVTT